MPIKTFPKYIARIENKAVKLGKGQLATKLGLRHGYILKDENGADKLLNATEFIKQISYKFEQSSEKRFSLEFEYNGKKGKTTADLEKQFNPELPTLINHHGLGNMAHRKITLALIAEPIKRVRKNLNRVINSLEPNEKSFEDSYNIFSIKASYHESIQILNENCVNKFSNIVLTILASVLMEEELVKWSKTQSNQRVVCTGFSMGGIVASWHYFLYNTADFYVPVIAFPNMGEILLCDEHKSYFERHLKNFENKERYISCMNVPPELKQLRPKDKIMIILGSEDELVPYRLAKSFWNDYKVETYETGHMSIVLKLNDIKKALVNALDNTLNLP